MTKVSGHEAATTEFKDNPISRDLTEANQLEEGNTDASNEKFALGENQVEEGQEESSVDQDLRTFRFVRAYIEQPSFGCQLFSLPSHIMHH